MVMGLPPIMIWLAASIFVYASIAHHPDARVRHDNKWAGYRYYGLGGFMTIFANDLAHLPGGWWVVWGLFFPALVPWSLWDVWRAGREEWRDLHVDLTDMATATPEHECRRVRSLSPSPSPRGGGERRESLQRLSR